MCKVAIFEDEPMIQMMWEDVIDILGYEVSGSMQSEEEGVEFALAGELDVGILDVNLAGTRSDRILEALVARNIPVVVCSGLTDHDLPDHFSSQFVLKKPFSIEKAMRILKDTCSIQPKVSEDIKLQQ